MRGVVVLSVFIVLLINSSCNYFISSDQKASELATQRIDTINWNEVDSFPLFENCNELASRPEQKQCFETTFTTHISRSLKAYDFVVEEAVSDTVLLEFKIDNKGVISILEIQVTPKIKKQLKELENALRVSLDSLPKIYAAQKKSRSDYEVQLVPVATRFTLPILIEID